MTSRVTNVVVAGLGGQGVLKCTDILASAAFYAGLDVKKSEVHGMSQRGGSVSSDVRFGEDVLSPMVPSWEADFLLVLDSTQVEMNAHVLRPEGILIDPSSLEGVALENPKTLNVALLGYLSAFLELAEKHWRRAIAAHLPGKYLETNLQAFALGRAAGVPCAHHGGKY